jgi:hypothetical protein
MCDNLYVCFGVFCSWDVFLKQYFLVSESDIVLLFYTLFTACLQGSM